jgi:protein gp37
VADRSAIEWTDATWNPVTGCTKVSPGCDHCYAERIHERFHGKGSFATIVRSEPKLFLPFGWRKPRRVFVNSMADLFHDAVPDEYIAHVWSVMARTPQHTYQILTKRHGRMRALLNRPSFRDNLAHWTPAWPLPNVWLGVSVENQRWADIRLDALALTPAAVRWISAEPLLGRIDLSAWLVDHGDPDRPYGIPIDWVVVGGESGPGARPMHPDWARLLRDQCAAASVPFMFKQWGEWVAPNHMPDDTFMSWDCEHGADDCDRDQPWRVGKKRAGRLLDGVLHNAYPVVSRG